MEDEVQRNDEEMPATSLSVVPTLCKSKSYSQHGAFLTIPKQGNSVGLLFHPKSHCLLNPQHTLRLPVSPRRRRTMTKSIPTINRLRDKKLERAEDLERMSRILKRRSEEAKALKKKEAARPSPALSDKQAL